MIERDLRKIVTKSWDGWLDWLEPRGNAGIGRPDCDLLFEGRIVPMELKIGSCVEYEDIGDWFKPSKIRPDQISWSQRFRNAGGTSIWLFADAPNSLWVANNLVDHRKNYKEFRFEHARSVGASTLADDIRHFVKNIV